MRPLRSPTTQPAPQAAYELVPYDSHSNTESVEIDLDDVKESNAAAINQIISHYKIIKKLGAGGMGEVFLAEDTTLHRKVAIKFLSAESTADVHGKGRLLREAQAAAILDHPNICTIHEVREEAGRSFIVMQYVEGETLATRIRSKPLNLSECLEIAAQITDALSEAHSHGIIHRDIKPQNIMITARGQAKLMDFGLASCADQKLSTQSQANTAILLTDPGLVVGTVPYMSPEQLKGETLDCRTDIFSFGTVIYQMATGRQPFGASSDPQTIAAILTRDPSPLAGYAANVPGELQRIIDKVLAKNRDERYQTAADLMIELQSLKETVERETALARPSSIKDAVSADAEIRSRQTSSVTCDQVIAKTNRMDRLLNYFRRRTLAPVSVAAFLLLSMVLSMISTGGSAEIDSIAILPYSNASENPNLTYLSDGIAEGLIINLSQLPQLKVMSSTSSFRYRPPEVDPTEIGRRLNVNAVAIVHVRQIDDTVTISLELVDARDNHQIWGTQYDRKSNDILAVQAEMSQLISEKLRLRLTREEEKQVTRRYTNNNAAYQLYLQGRFYYHKLTEDAVNKSIVYYERAIAEDEHYALAYAALSVAYTTLGFNYLPPKQVMEHARAYAMKALELDSALAEAHLSLAYIKYGYDWNWTGAEGEFKRALDLDPNCVLAYEGYGYLLETLNQSPEAIKMTQRAIALDPISTIAHVNLAELYVGAGEYDQAIAAYRRALELDSNFYYAHLNIANIYALRGMRDEALAELSAATAMQAENPLVRAATALVYARTGKAREAQSVLNSLLAASTQKYIWPYDVASICAALDRRDQTLEWLERSFQERSISMLRLGIDPQFNGLHDDQKFKDLLRRIGLPL